MHLSIDHDLLSCYPAGASRSSGSTGLPVHRHHRWVYQESIKRAWIGAMPREADQKGLSMGGVWIPELVNTEGCQPRWVTIFELPMNTIWIHLGRFFLLDALLDGKLMVFMFLFWCSISLLLEQLAHSRSPGVILKHHLATVGVAGRAVCRPCWTGVKA